MGREHRRCPPRVADAGTAGVGDFFPVRRASRGTATKPPQHVATGFGEPVRQALRADLGSPAGPGSCPTQPATRVQRRIGGLNVCLPR
jgi:hypothetical protein